MTEFIKHLNSIFGESISLSDTAVLETSSSWDSMSQLVIASWIHRETGHLVSAEEIKQAKTIGDLKAIYISKL